jgi:hypothetical protein
LRRKSMLRQTKKEPANRGPFGGSNSEVFRIGGEKTLEAQASRDLIAHASNISRASGQPPFDLGLPALHGSDLDSGGAAGSGRGGIRTHERVAPLPVFKTGALNHSATRPRVDLLGFAGRRNLRRQLFANRLANQLARAAASSAPSAVNSEWLAHLAPPLSTHAWPRPKIAHWETRLKGRACSAGISNRRQGVSGCSA